MERAVEWRGEQRKGQRMEAGKRRIRQDRAMRAGEDAIAHRNNNSEFFF